MEKGIVKWFDGKRGFGFIKRMNGQEVFVHSKAITDTVHTQLAPGDNVQFEVEQRLKGLQAYRVVKISF